jgi:DNA gyrase inhibitor GyrI
MKSRDLSVRIIRLEPMRIARTLAFGEEPESLAWNKLLEWARSQGLVDGLQKPRFFGFDNPRPSTRRSPYGYEVWMTVGPEVEPDVEIGIGISDFPGGLFAVTRYDGREGQDLKKAWEELVAWVGKSPYRLTRGRWLEEVVNLSGLPQKDLILDLYLPVNP